MSENDEAGSDEGASIEVELIMDSEAFHVTVVTTETVVGATRRAVGAREGAQIEIHVGSRFEMRTGPSLRSMQGSG